MSTSRDGGTRGGRGRGTTFNNGAPRSRGRGRGDFASFSGRGGSNANRGTPNSPSRGNGPPSTRGRGRGQASPITAIGRGSRGLGGAPMTGSWQERQEKLKAHREQERKDAIAQGLMTDPDKAVALADAITLVGTCQGMCSEYEMVLRVNRNEVFPEEKVNGDPNGEPDESRFVKTFKRSEAGAEAQLPSDLRPPGSLKRTCDYLFNEIIGNAATLGKVHHFVWDRTRAIRNDFSIQQLTKLDDLRIAIECYERIARFHIVSLHQLALAKKPYDKYDPQQEREQLDRTLLSLMQYYDDTRGRLENTNEAEFRAYCVIFAITNPVPDLEDRVQTWPRQITKDMRVQTALEVYAAACQTTYGQGPMPPKVKPVIAQQDWQKFWNLVQSRKVSYLAACVCEIFFNYVREIALKSLIRSLRTTRRAPDGTVPVNPELSLDHVAEALQYDDIDDLYSFVARWGLEFRPADDGTTYLDIRNVASTVLPEPKTGATQQKSFLVESKRFGRTLPAVIDGLTVRQAAAQGMIIEEEHEEEMDDAEEMEEEEEEEAEDGDEETEDEGNGLFVGPSKYDQEQSQQSLINHETLDKVSPSNATSTGCGAPSTAFGVPTLGVQSSTVNGASNPIASSGFGQPSSAFSASKPMEASQKGDGTIEAPKSAFGGSNPFGKPAVASNPWASPSPFGAPTTGAPKANPFTPSTTLSLTAKSDGAEPKARPFAPSTTLSFTADNKDDTPQSTFNAGSAFGAPSTAAPPVASAPEPAKPKSSSLVKKGPFEEDPSPTTPTKSPEKQDFSQAEEASKLQPSALQQTSDSPAAPSLSARSETNSKSAPAPAQQPPQTAAPTSTSSQPPTSQPLPPGVQSPNKRRSSGWEDNKPKRPSPLQNSHTPTPNSTTRATQQPDIHVARDVSTAPAKAPPPPPEKTTDELLTEIAQIVTFDPAWGIWKQFVDFQVSQAIAKAQEKVEREIDEEKAKIFYREWVVKRVKRLLRQRVRKRRATVRRERTRRRLRESTLSNGSSAAPMGNSTSSFGASGATSQSQANGVNQGHADVLLQSIARGRQSHLEAQTQAGSKRSASAYGSDVAASTSSPMHKRQKSMSHVDDRGKITKPTPPSEPTDDIIKRSSFLGFSSRDAQQRANTTKSTYFRMKALGLQSRSTGLDLATSRGTKRQRSESLDAASMPPPARPNAPTVAASSPEAHSVASARSVRSKADEEDEALFARLKAAREALRDGEKGMREEVAKEELRRSMNDSQSSNESPSLARARAEARLRASRGNSETRERDVPAYRLRESRFVPREEYHLAEERARQMRASRANSRAVSREGSRPPEVAKGVAGSANDKETASMLFDSPPKPAQPSKLSSAFGAPAQTATAPSFGVGAPTPAPAVQPAVPDVSARNPFSQSSSFAPPSNGQNPFLQTFGATNATSFDDIPQDNTLAASQINGTLARPFGQPSQVTPSAFARAAQNSPTPPQTNSHMPSQAASEAISLLSDDEEETQEQSQQEKQSGEISYGRQAFLDATTDNDINAAFAERSATVSFDQQEAASQALLRGAYDYTSNPFAALADGVSDNEQLEEVDHDQQSEDAYEEDDQPGTAPQPDSYQYSDDQEGDYEGEGTSVDEYSDDDVAPSGYIDSEAEEDGDIEDEDGDLGEERPHDWDSEADGHWEFEDDGEEEEPRSFAPLNNAYNARVMQTAPEKESALQMVGNTEEEAIELSD